jgi:hypothetical protein
MSAQMVWRASRAVFLARTRLHAPRPYPALARDGLAYTFCFTEIEKPFFLDDLLITIGAAIGSILVWQHINAA